MMLRDTKSIVVEFILFPFVQSPDDRKYIILSRPDEDKIPLARSLVDRRQSESTHVDFQPKFSM